MIPQDQPVRVTDAVHQCCDELDDEQLLTVYRGALVQVAAHTDLGEVARTVAKVHALVNTGQTWFLRMSR